MALYGCSSLRANAMATQSVLAYSFVALKPGGSYRSGGPFSSLMKKVTASTVDKEIKAVNKFLKLGLL